jgi:hypothetical protein
MVFLVLKNKEFTISGIKIVSLNPNPHCFIAITKATASG